MIALLIANLFWGLGFTATVWVLDFLDPAFTLFYRLILCFLLTSTVLVFAKKSKWLSKKNFFLSFWPGIFLGLNLLFQTIGLQTTTASKSAFITVLYVVMVPFLEMLFHRAKISVFHFISVGLALVGVGFISQILGIENGGIKIIQLEINQGDLLTLICAFFAAVQILLLGPISNKTDSPFALNGFQALVAAMVMVPMLFFESRYDFLSLSQKGWMGLLITAVGGSTIAFYLQIRAQKTLSPSLASIMFLLESPFAFFFAAIFLGETLNLSQSLGCVFIVFACLLSIWSFRNPKTLPSKT